MSMFLFVTFCMLTIFLIFYCLYSALESKPVVISTLIGIWIGLVIILILSTPHTKVPTTQENIYNLECEIKGHREILKVEERTGIKLSLDSKKAILDKYKEGNK